MLVPLSAELGFNIGVTGREPLNNQPYFRMTRLGDDTPVHEKGRAAFAFMLELVESCQADDDGSPPGGLARVYRGSARLHPEIRDQGG